MSTFDEIAGDIVQKKLTGLFSVVMKKVEHHLKIFFADGEVYYMTYGDLKDADCLDACTKFELSACFFANGVKVARSEKCPVPTGTVIEFLKKWLGAHASADLGPKPEIRTQSHSDLIEKLKKALMRQVGPIGEILFSGILEQCSLSSPPTKEQLTVLVNLIREKIEDQQSRKEFMNEASAIIS